MKFFAVAALFAAAAMAIPHETPVPVHVQQQQTTCGNAQLSCCDEIDPTAEVSKSEKNGLLSLLDGNILSDGGVAKYRGCSGLVDAKNLVSGQCNNHVACCNNVDSSNVGLINVAVPCIPLSLL